MIRIFGSMLLFLLLLIFAPRAITGQSADREIQSPADLWRGFDPEPLPLDIEVLKSWQEEGCALEKLRFTGEIAEGGRTRVLAVQGSPIRGTRLAGILHIHGGGQTLSLDWVKFWAKRGYVCVSFDFCGKWENRAEYTDWGPIPRGNMAQANGGLQVHPTPRESSWYHWAVTARRALTLLARHPSVDRNRLGIFGVSVGGNLTSMVAGSDKRVKAAVPIYGSGYNYDRGKADWGFGAQSADMARFQRTLSPEAHAPYISCPVLHLDATNDHHAWMDASYLLLAAVPAQIRQAFTPHFIHHIEPEQGADLPLWMDWHLRGGKPFPATPSLSVSVTPSSDGEPVADLATADKQHVKVREIYYSIGKKLPPARFWRRADVHSLHGKAWIAYLPVADPWDDLFVFANCTFDSGVCLSSNLVHVVPARLGKARATLEWQPSLTDGRTGLDHWYFTAAYTDPVLSKKYLRIEREGSQRFVARPYLTLNPELFGAMIGFSISSHILGDPGFQGRAGQALAFDCRGGFDVAGLKVTIVENDWGPRPRTYTATVGREALGADWKTVRISLERFASQDGKPPAAWNVIDKIEIGGTTTRQAPACFSNFRWETAPAG